MSRFVIPKGKCPMVLRMAHDNMDHLAFKKVTNMVG